MPHTYTRIAAGVFATLLPFQALAATLMAEDSIAGLGVSLSVSGALPNAAVTFVVNDPTNKKTTVEAQTDAKGSASAHLQSAKTERAGQYDISVNSDRTTIASGKVTVAPDSIDPWTSTVQAWTPYIEADGNDKGEVSVTVRDKFGNPLAGRPIALVSSRTEDAVSALTPQTDNEGVQHFIVTTDSPGSMQLRAIDLLSGNTIVESAEIEADAVGMGGVERTASNSNTSGKRFYTAQVGSNFGILDHLEVDAPATMMTEVEAPKITIKAVDRDGVVIENYNGTVRFQTTDPKASVPNFGSYTFKERDLGEKTFALALKFRTAGEQTLRVEDANDPRIFGEAVIDVGGGHSASQQITVTSHSNGDSVNTLSITLEGNGPRNAKLIVMGGVEDAFGTTESDGRFSIPVNLNPEQHDFTLRIRDDAGNYDSGSLHLILDQEKPEIASIQFVPKEPEEGDKVLVVIESEENLAQALVRLPNSASKTIEEIKLTPNPSQAGSYQAFFTAPAPGTYQPSVTAVDKAGNREEVRTELNVTGQSLPIVQNVKAEARIDAVEVTWDAIAGEVDGYRIYVGDSPSSFYSLNTERAVTKATVKGLTPGKTYYFGVTALRGETESGEKSNLAQAQVLGFKLDITPKNSALQISWTSLSVDLPLSAFLLEYGTDEANLSEKRMLNGELRDFTIRDLIGGVSYFVRVTPITVTGDTLEELAAKGFATPENGTFVASARDDIPFDIPSSPTGPLHSGAPNNPATGPSTFAWIAAAMMGMLGVAYFVYRRNSISKTQAFLNAVQAQYSGL